MFTCCYSEYSPLHANQHILNKREVFTACGRSVTKSMAGHVIFFSGSQSIPGHEHSCHFHNVFHCLFLALLHHNLTTTLALLHMLNNRRRERGEMASRHMKPAPHAGRAAVNRGKKQWKLQQEYLLPWGSLHVSIMWQTWAQSMCTKEVTACSESNFYYQNFYCSD